MPNGNRGNGRNRAPRSRDTVSRRRIPSEKELVSRQRRAARASEPILWGKGPIDELQPWVRDHIIFFRASAKLDATAMEQKIAHHEEKRVEATSEGDGFDQVLEELTQSRKKPDTQFYRVAIALAGRRAEEYKHAIDLEVLRYIQKSRKWMRVDTGALVECQTHIAAFRRQEELFQERLHNIPILEAWAEHEFHRLRKR